MDRRERNERPATVWLPGTFPASVAVETEHHLSLEGGNERHSGGERSFVPWQQGRQTKERPFHSAFRINPPAAVSLRLTALSRGSRVKVPLKQAQTDWIRRLFASLHVCFEFDTPFTPFNCYSFLLSLTSPRHNVLPLCAELDPLYVPSVSRQYPDLSSLRLYAHREINFSSSVAAQARIALTCPSSTPVFLEMMLTFDGFTGGSPFPGK